MVLCTYICLHSFVFVVNINGLNGLWSIFERELVTLTCVKTNWQVKWHWQNNYLLETASTFCYIRCSNRCIFFGCCSMSVKMALDIKLGLKTCRATRNPEFPRTGPDRTETGPGSENILKNIFGSGRGILFRVGPGRGILFRIGIFFYRGMRHFLLEFRG